jgi:hypothetical protein
LLRALILQPTLKKTVAYQRDRLLIGSIHTCYPHSALHVSANSSFTPGVEAD